MNRKQRRATKRANHATGLASPKPNQSLLAEAFRHHEAGRWPEAERLYRAILSTEPRDAFVMSLLGMLAHQLGNNDTAVSLLTRAISLDGVPASLGFSAHLSLGNALQAQGKLEDAAASFRRALTLKPDLAEAHYNLANALSEQGKVVAALESYGRALSHDPQFILAEMNLAFTQLSRPGVKLAEVLAQAQRWNDRYKAHLPNRWLAEARPAQPDTLPRIGFVSADFCDHAVGRLVIPAIEGLARAGYRVTCYSNSEKRDEFTTRFVKAASVWRYVGKETDGALAELILSDGIDILFDLSGYSLGNRLLVFAQKPAPIQITWVGYPATTGLRTMDYFLADRYQIPPGAEAYYSEAVIRLPDSYIAFEPPHESTKANLPPLPLRGIVFGSFNALHKVNADVVAAWSRILTQMPDSHLILKGRSLDCPGTRRHYASLFAAHGIAEERLTFVGYTTVAEHLAWMQRAHIALDTFPYAGGQTTLEVLWMGLPVVTLPGETLASRHSLGYLSNIGLGELAATSVDHYVELATKLANDPTSLADMRAGLRSRIMNSPLCNVGRFTGNLSAALTAVWQRYCTG